MYLLVKACHLVAVITWVSGMLSVTQQLSRRAREGDAVDAQGLLAVEATWTVSAMAIVWTLGFWMATQVRWWIHPWFVAKFFVVLLLSGMHGKLAGTLRRLVENPDLPSAGWHRYAPGLLLAMVLTVVVLVIVKPG